MHKEDKRIKILVNKTNQKQAKLISSASIHAINSVLEFF